MLPKSWKTFVFFHIPAQLQSILPEGQKACFLSTLGSWYFPFMSRIAPTESVWFVSQLQGAMRTVEFRGSFPRTCCFRAFSRPALRRLAHPMLPKPQSRQHQEQTPEKQEQREVSISCRCASYFRWILDHRRNYADRRQHTSRFVFLPLFHDVARFIKPTRPRLNQRVHTIKLLQFMHNIVKRVNSYFHKINAPQGAWFLPPKLQR